jgi:hypothetical protein
MNLKFNPNVKTADKQRQRYENICAVYRLVANGVCTVKEIHDHLPWISTETLTAYLCELKASRDITQDCRVGRVMKYKILDPKEVAPDLPAELLVMMGYAPWPAPEGEPVEFKLKPIEAKPRRREFSYGVSNMDAGL